jgi:hypothetical protein
VFGVSLAHLWERKFSPDLPVVITSCVDYINKYGTPSISCLLFFRPSPPFSPLSHITAGLNTEGVLQDPGKKEMVEQLRDAFDRGEIDLEALNPDAHSVGEVLRVSVRGERARINQLLTSPI